MRPALVPFDVQRPTRANDSCRISKQSSPAQLDGSGNAKLNLQLDGGVRLNTAPGIVDEALYANVPEPKGEHVKHMAADVKQDTAATCPVEAKLVYCFPRKRVSIFDRNTFDVAKHPACNAFPSHPH